MLFGIGGGWNVEEMENHGANCKKRWKTVREKILAMREIWTKEEAEFHGEIVNFDKIWSYPKPVQPGGPPVLMGSGSQEGLRARRRLLRRMAADQSRRHTDWPALIKQLREAEKARGRKKLSLSLFGAPGEGGRAEAAHRTRLRAAAVPASSRAARHRDADDRQLREGHGKDALIAITNAVCGVASDKDAAPQTEAECGEYSASR